MKIQEHGSARNATVAILKGDSQLKEYEAHLESPGGPACAYVPVVAGDKLTVTCQFEGITKGFQFDLVVDGFLRQSKTFKPKDCKKFTKKEIFSNAVCRGAKGDGLRTADVKVQAVKQQTASSSDDSGETPNALGTITVVICLRLPTDEATHKLRADASYEVIRWGEFGELPTGLEYCIDYPSIGEAELKGGSATKARKESREARPGSQPWAICKFYYCSQDKIDNSGFVLATQPLVLEPGMAGDATIGAENVPTPPATPKISNKKPPGNPSGSSKASNKRPAAQSFDEGEEFELELPRTSSKKSKKSAKEKATMATSAPGVAPAAAEQVNASATGTSASTPMSERLAAEKAELEEQARKTNDSKQRLAAIKIRQQQVLDSFSIKKAKLQKEEQEADDEYNQIEAELEKIDADMA
ncbi:hypothetical protein K402DRAFT_466847 [Aulographum hederae CBS 113979]|uniref:Uncharacterized protein n=1 Tax=Aulographum hederae CBS 113979 TaxID=1176131 RepID=A0A6G1GNI9_9PEZI|nr:hypothetical protein K402DRAFT_466847 [Aulographum hederae CBS 113979]